MEIITKQQIIEKLEELPTLPSIVYELSRLINDPMSSTTDIERVMSDDQSLTSKVLKLANSAYYAIPGGVSNLARAIAHIGFDTIQQLVLATSVLDSLRVDDQQSQFNVIEFWKHSVGVAMAAETIAREVGYKVPADIFTCGLLHDMGKIALLKVEPSVLEQVAIHASMCNITFYAAEVELETPPHTWIGMSLAQKWTLPNHIQNALQYHHEINSNVRGGASPELNQIIDMVSLANLLVHALKFGNSGYEHIAPAPKTLFERLSLDQSQLQQLVAKIKKALLNADAFLQIIG